jgi:hypothetical protein
LRRIQVNTTNGRRYPNRKDSDALFAFLCGAQEIQRMRLFGGILLTGLVIFARPFGGFADYGSLGLILDIVYLVAFGFGAYLIITDESDRREAGTIKE